MLGETRRVFLCFLSTWACSSLLGCEQMKSFPLFMRVTFATAIGGATSNNTRAPARGILNYTIPSSIDQVSAYLASSDGAKPKIADSLHIILIGQNNIAANTLATGAGEFFVFL